MALARLPDGTRDVLGIWVEQTEGAKFWLKDFNELRNRGVNDILIAAPSGFPEARAMHTFADVGKTLSQSEE